MNWWMIIVAVVAALLTVGISLYIVIWFSAPQDKTAYFPKGVAVAGLTLACFTVLLLPFDVANRREPTSFRELGGGLDVAAMWQVCLWTVAVFVLVIIPFATFFYEAHDPDHYSFLQQCTPAVLYTCALCIVFLVFLIVLWLTVGYADIPFYSYITLPQFKDPFDARLLYVQNKGEDAIEIQVSIFVYLVGLLAAAGWILFAFFGGVGLPGLPADLMRNWGAMPKKPMTDKEYLQQREEIAGKALKMQKEGKQLQDKQKKSNNAGLRRKINKFKGEVGLLERGLEHMEMAYDERDTLMFKVFGYFLLGLTCMIISFFWILHIFFHNIIGLSGFLNVVLIAFDRSFTPLGCVFYAIFAYYLLWCSVKGCVMLGLRLLFFQVHPLKVGDTPANGILFNVGLILLTSIVVVQFCAWSFREYAANTAVDTLLNTYVLRLRGLKYIIRYAAFFFLGIAILSTCWVVMCPRAPPEKEKDDDDDD